MKKLFCAAACFCGMIFLCQGNTVDHYKTNPWKLIEAKKLDEAIVVFDLRIMDPKCSDAMKLQAINGSLGVFSRTGKRDKAIELLDKYLANKELEKFHPVIMAHKGRHLHAMKKFPEAIATLKQAAELSKGTPEQLTVLYYAFNTGATVYALQKEMPYFVDCALANPHLDKDLNMLIMASETCWRINRHDDGLALARRAEKAATAPNVNVYRVLGYHLRGTQEFEKAEQAFLKAIEICKSEGDKATLYRNIGENWERAEEYEKAIPYFQKAADCPVKGWWTKSAADSVKRLQKKIANGE